MIPTLIILGAFIIYAVCRALYTGVVCVLRCYSWHCWALRVAPELFDSRRDVAISCWRMAPLLLNTGTYYNGNSRWSGVRDWEVNA